MSLRVTNYCCLDAYKWVLCLDWTNVSRHMLMTSKYLPPGSAESPGRPVRHLSVTRCDLCMTRFQLMMGHSSTTLIHTPAFSRLTVFRPIRKSPASRLTPARWNGPSGSSWLDSLKAPESREDTPQNPARVPAEGITDSFGRSSA